MILNIFSSWPMVQFALLACLTIVFGIFWITRFDERSSIRKEQLEKEKRVAIEYTRKNATDIGHIEGD